jgi:hypothetical protein
MDMIVSDHVHCSKDDRSPLVLMSSSYFNDVYLMDHPCVRIAMIFITLVIMSCIFVSPCVNMIRLQFFLLLYELRL